jgi:DNA polymerase-3 subunit epsilon
LLNLPDFSPYHGVIDTLVHAKELHPGKRNSLDACATATAFRTPTASCTARCWTELLADVYGHDAWPEQSGHGC